MSTINIPRESTMQEIAQALSLIHIFQAVRNLCSINGRAARRLRKMFFIL